LCSSFYFYFNQIFKNQQSKKLKIKKINNQKNQKTKNKKKRIMSGSPKTKCDAKMDDAKMDEKMDDANPQQLILTFSERSVNYSNYKWEIRVADECTVNVLEIYEDATLEDVEELIQEALGIAPRNQRWRVLFKHDSGVVFDFGPYFDDGQDTHSYFHDNGRIRDEAKDTALAALFEMVMDPYNTAYLLSDQFPVFSCVCNKTSCNICR